MSEKPVRRSRSRHAGSITSYETQSDLRSGLSNCRCKAEPPVLHGPYLHWTRTVAGKTMTRTLTPEQAERYQPWFDNARRLRQALTELEAQSLQAFLDAEAPNG